MKSGYKIFWTEHAASELEKTIQYLQTEFSDKEISKLLIKLKESIEKGLEDANSGKLKPHSEIRKKYEKWL